MSTRAYVLLTAMPPTRGHMALIQFARGVADTVEVHLQTQPGEPLVQARYDSLVAATRHMDNVNIHWMHKPLPQEASPEDEAKFWDMWAGFLADWGIQTSDFIVASEDYGIKLAEFTGATFIPYDIDREVVKTKATPVRKNTLSHFDKIIPEFQPYLRKRITIFGAESTGKTTLARWLAEVVNGQFLPEWARPYLEHVGPEITWDKMRNIWYGQRALQDSADVVAINKPFIIQDTDLYSTLGYWQYNSWQIDGEVPAGLHVDAVERKSDLYIITPSNIPFEADQLRYGGDHREIETEEWTTFAKLHNLNYIVLESDELTKRTSESLRAIWKLFGTPLEYEREGNDHA